MLFPHCLGNRWERYWASEGWMGQPMGRGEGIQRPSQALVPGHSLSGPTYRADLGIALLLELCDETPGSPRRGGRCCSLGLQRQGPYPQPAPLAWRPGTLGSGRHDGGWTGRWAAMLPLVPDQTSWGHHGEQGVTHALLLAACSRCPNCLLASDKQPDNR